MRLTKENKDKIRTRIVAGAAKLFRTHGVAAINLDKVMAEAELTRGAFYAHFKSKTDLLVAVVRQDHPLLRRLEARTGQTPEALRTQLLEVFEGYLAPQNLPLVFQGCTLAALSETAAQASGDVRTAYGAARQDIIDEMRRGQSDLSAETCSAVLSLAMGAVLSAAASDTPNRQADILNPAWTLVQTLLSAKT